MDLYFYYDSLTDIPLYNCSAITKEELLRLRAIRHPFRGAAVFMVGFPMVLVYCACLRVMMRLLSANPCYKIMFVLGLYEISAVLINDVIIAYILTFGLTFCDAPNVFYAIGSLQVATWAGASFFCLYLAFNRMIEILKMRREVIEFFFAPKRTNIGLLIGCIYTLAFFFFATPSIFSNEVLAPLPNPLGLEMSSSVKMKHTLMVGDNCGVIILTAILYGVFCILLRKKFKKIGFPESRNFLQHQVFIQSTLLCAFNFLISILYTLYLFVGENVLFVQICYFVYQFTSGLQALVYLLFNQTILNGVKNDLYNLLKIDRDVVTDIQTTKSTMKDGTQCASNALSVPSIR